ncbi:beta strand repeat-containing protein [Wenzhouxiangella marina]|uniref:Uncharacterized protein n=1 Tax=Wenzhouxiangella marina TaxID=1579979 RepID=A0A0K0Y022_9GAMM|nr:IPTL-CTERM sorting domain-containing protein [Wenzhouxiangella marina]AKS43237.1 hypothetical protein WM2015_2880 [Wenzhouxiangella marina]MBB6087076.1 hypothetical protein [Wenzhouxiangella marina]
MFRWILALVAIAAASLAVPVLAQTPPVFSKGFTPPTITVSGQSTLVYTLDNSANGAAATAVDFTEVFPPGMTIAPTPSEATTCIGGTLTAVAATDTFSYTGGEIPASASCTVSVAVVVNAIGSYPTTSGDLTSSFGNSGTASATLVAVIDQNLSVTGIYAPSLTAASTLDIAVQNLSATDAVNAPIEISVTGTNSGTVTVSETIALVPANTTLIYTTANAFDLSADSAFAFEATTPSSNLANDTFISDAWRTSPVKEDFEGRTVASYQQDSLLPEVPGFSYLQSSAGGRITLRTDFDPDGQRILSMDNPGAGGLNHTILSFDATSIPAGQEIFLDFNWYDHGDEGDFQDIVELRGSPLDPWIEIYDFAANSNNGAWTNVNGIELTAFLTANTQTLTDQAQLRFSQTDNFPINTDGISLDDIVVGPSLKFSKAFAPSLVALGDSSTLTFFLNNNNGTLDSMGVDFIDNLPAGMNVATPSNASTDCAGGTLTASDGAAVIIYTGGTVPAGTSCTVTVDVVTSLPGGLVNISGDATSSAGNSGPAEATLIVTDLPIFTKAFGPNPTQVGVPSTLSFTIDNLDNVVSVTALDFTDPLPAGMVVATPANASTTCLGGSITAAAGSSSISYTGGSVDLGTVCSVSVDVVVQEPGNYLNTSGDLTSSLGNSGPATDTLVVDSVPLDFSKSFAPVGTDVGVPATLSFTIDNPNAAQALSLAFTDVMPAGLVVANPANATNSCIASTLVANPGSGTIELTGGEVPASDFCVISVDVVSDQPGIFDNITGNLTSNMGTSAPATAQLIVGADVPSLTMVFTPVSTPVGVPSTMTLTLDNTTNAAPALDAAFGNALPANLAVAAVPNASNTCGGTLTAAAGTVSLSGGTIPANGSCTVEVDLVSAIPGVYTNTTSTLTTSFGTNSSAQATLTVIGDVPVFHKAFGAPMTPVGAPVNLIFTLDNSANAAPASNATFTDPMPAGLVVANPANVSNTCGGIFDAGPGNGTVTLSGGSVPASGSCTISVSVVSNLPGDITNLTGDLTSSLGNSGPASASLMILGTPPQFTIGFNPTTIAPSEPSTVTFTIDNGSTPIAATGLAFSVTLPPGLWFVEPVAPVDTCTGGTVSVVGDTLSYSGGSVPANDSCSISVQVTAASGAYTLSSTLNSDLGSSPSSDATAGLSVMAFPVPTLSNWGLLTLMLLMGLMLVIGQRRLFA